MLAPLDVRLQAPQNRCSPLKMDTKSRVIGTKKEEENQMKYKEKKHNYILKFIDVMHSVLILENFKQSNNKCTITDSDRPVLHSWGF